MRRTTKSMMVAAAAALGMSVVPAVAGAAPADETPKSDAAKFFATLPDAPIECAEWWDPIEDRIEESVDLTKVPAWAQESFEAFDEWCEAPAEARDEAQKNGGHATPDEK